VASKRSRAYAMSAALTVYDALNTTVQRRPGATALIFQGSRVTYEELIQRIDETAEALLDQGISRGDAFAVYAQNCPEFIYCYYAAAKIGAVYIPINPNVTSPEVRYIFGHSDAKCLFHDSTVAGQASDAISQEQRRPLSVLASRGSMSTPVRQSANPARHEDFLICYTSGSTGVPKAVVLDHEAQVAVCESLIELWGICEQDVTLVALPMGFLYGLSTAAAVALRAGGIVVLLPKFRPSDVLQAFGGAGVSVFHGVPTMFSMMLEYVEQNRVSFDLSGIRQMISAGAPLTDEVARRFERTFRKKLQNYYAMTECAPVFGVYASDPMGVPEGAIGKKAPGVAVKVIGPNKEECGPGVDGELYVRGPATLKCYHKDPALTAAALDDGWFKSGDLGHYDESGYYYITGRIKDIIIRGGANIAPAEVERVLSRHPAVQDVAIVGVADRIFGEVPLAFVVTRGGRTVSAEELMKYAQSELADFKVPRQYVFRDALPVGKTGKVDKNALKASWEVQVEK
jgi:long-chain acyl-CoA synthetase